MHLQLLVNFCRIKKNRLQMELVYQTRKMYSINLLRCVFSYWNCLLNICRNFALKFKGPSWSYGSWIYNYLWNQCLSTLTLWVQILFKRGVLDTILCDFLDQENWPPGYNWNIVESGVKHHNPNSVLKCLRNRYKFCSFAYCTTQVLNGES
jgi:hypothetical protein